MDLLSKDQKGAFPMNYCTTIFQQLLSILPRTAFERATTQFGGDRYVKSFTCWNQFTANFYAQATGKDSLREIVTGLKVEGKRWYHMGLQSIARSTLAYANANRDCQIFQNLFYSFLNQCRDLTPKHRFRFKNPLYSLDSSVIDLCLSLYPWATFRTRKGALKMHTLLDHRGHIPAFLVVTEGKRHDISVAKELELPLSRDSILVMDRAYIDFEWLHRLDSQGVFFVSRAKQRMRHRVLGQHPTTRKGVLADETIEITGTSSQVKYPKKLRLVTFVDEAAKKVYRFLTNNFRLSARTIADIYKDRWQIELFFKWVKQHLKIKTFLGTTKNAVMTQIWTAMLYYLLLHYMKYQTKYANSMLEMSRLIDAALFKQVSFLNLLSLNFDTLKKLSPGKEQLVFW
jgi:hypothetical protein